MRVLENGAYIDMQVYRDGGGLDTVAAKYKQVAETTGHFRLPRQRIILWRGSESDQSEPFAEALGDLKDMMTVVDLLHPQGAVAGAGILNRMIQEVPDSVVIAFIGRFLRRGALCCRPNPPFPSSPCRPVPGISRGCLGRRCARRARCG